MLAGASPVTSSLKIALVESQDLFAKTWSPSPQEYSNRASSITPSSKSFLQSIGTWDNLDVSRIQPYHGMQVWDGVSGSRIEFDWQDQSLRDDSTIAYMTENSNLVRSLLDSLVELGGVTMFDGTRVTDISLGPSAVGDADSLDLSLWPHLALSNNRTIAARFLVGADGPNSPVRAFAGIESHGWNYDRHGVVATLRFAEEPDFKIAFQRFLPSGPVALLPLPGPFATLVWSTTPSHAAHLKALSSVDFVSMVNAAFRLSPVDITYMQTIASGQEDELSWRLEHTPRMAEGMQVPNSVIAIQEGSIASFPLCLRHADTYATHRIALVGDAAHTIHPLAGQGLNMGLGDVKALFDVLEYAVNHGQDIGDQLTLESYTSARYEPNHRMIGVVDKLHKLYSFGSGPVVGLRSWGLEAINAIAPVKKFLMRQAASGGA